MVIGAGHQQPRWRHLRLLTPSTTSKKAREQFARRLVVLLMAAVRLARPLQYRDAESLSPRPIPGVHQSAEKGLLRMALGDERASDRTLTCLLLKAELEFPASRSLIRLTRGSAPSSPAPASTSRDRDALATKSGAVI